MASTLREYLVSLGVVIDEKGIKKMHTALSATKKTVLGVGTAMAAFLVIAGKTSASLDQTSQKYEQMARAAHTTTEKIRAQETALKVLGKTLDEVNKDEKLKARYNALVNIGKELALPQAQGGVQMLRDIMGGVEELRVKATYALQWINYHFLNKIRGPLEQIRNGITNFSLKLSANLPKWTEAIGTGLSYIVRLAMAGVNGAADLIHWIGQLPDIVKEVGAAVAAAFGAAQLGPVGLTIAAISGLLLVLEDYYTWKSGGESAMGKFWQSIADGTMIDTVKEKLTSFVESLGGIGEKIRDALNIDGDENLFIGIGKKVAGWIREGFTNVNNWTKVKLANLLGITTDNEGEDKITWKAIGEKVAGYIKEGFIAFSDWAKVKLSNLLGITSENEREDETTWGDIGRGVAEKIKNGFIEFSDWAKVKISNLLGITKDLAPGEEDVTWKEIGRGLAAKIVEGFSSVKNWAAAKLTRLLGIETEDGQPADWKEIGSNVAKKIREGFTSAKDWAASKLTRLLGIETEDGKAADWKEIGKKIATDITDGFKSSGSFIKKLILGDEYSEESTWTDVGNKIWESLEKAFEGKDIIGTLFEHFGEKIEGIVNFVSKIFTGITSWLSDNANLEKLGSLLGNVMRQLFPVIMELAEQLAQAIWIAIGELVPEGNIKSALWGDYYSKRAEEILNENGEGEVSGGPVSDAAEAAARAILAATNWGGYNDKIEQRNDLIDVIYADKAAAEARSEERRSHAEEGEKIYSDFDAAYKKWEEEIGSFDPYAVVEKLESEKTESGEPLSDEEFSRRYQEEEDAWIANRKAVLEENTRKWMIENFGSDSGYDTFKALTDERRKYVVKENPELFSQIYGQLYEIKSGIDPSKQIKVTSEMQEYALSLLKLVKEHQGYYLRMDLEKTDPNSYGYEAGLLAQRLQGPVTVGNKVYPMLDEKSFLSMYGIDETTEKVNELGEAVTEITGTHEVIFNVDVNGNFGILADYYDGSDSRIVNGIKHQRKYGFGGRFSRPTKGEIGEDGTEYLIPITNPGRARQLTVQMVREMGSRARGILEDLGIPAGVDTESMGGPGQPYYRQPAGMYPLAASGGKSNSDNTVTSTTHIYVQGSSDPEKTGRAAAKANESNLVRTVRGCFE